MNNQSDFMEKADNVSIHVLLNVILPYFIDFFDKEFLFLLIFYCFFTHNTL